MNKADAIKYTVLLIVLGIAIVVTYGQDIAGSSDVTTNCVNCTAP